MSSFIVRSATNSKQKIKCIISNNISTIYKLIIYIYTVESHYFENPSITNKVQEEKNDLLNLKTEKIKNIHLLL